MIDRILSNGLVFQAFHQHFFDLKPQLWHVHVRGTGTPLDADLLANILGGEVEVGEEGAVHVSVPRREQIILARVPVASGPGVEHTIAFEPLGSGRTAVAPDFALTAADVNPVMAITRKYGFTVHCLYNQPCSRARRATG